MTPWFKLAERAVVALELIARALASPDEPESTAAQEDRHAA